VVRQHKLGEADRIIHVADPPARSGAGGGQGGAADQARFGARLETFAYVDVQLHPGGIWTRFTQGVHTMEAFATDIVDDYGR